MTRAKAFENLFNCYFDKIMEMTTSEFERFMYGELHCTNRDILERMFPDTNFDVLDSNWLDEPYDGGTSE